MYELIYRTKYFEYARITHHVWWVYRSTPA